MDPGGGLIPKVLCEEETMRTFAALAMFFFGSTFLWLTASFAGRAMPPTGIAWTVVNLASLVAVAGFTVAAWGLYREESWWQVVAVGSAVVGLVALVPFLVGMRQIDANLADLGVQINIWMHALGAAVVLAIVRVPVLADWFEARMS
jgi:hypothetical protein